MFNDTIAAVATTLGEAGIGIIRLSGSEAISIADKVFRAKNCRKLAGQPGFTVRYGKIVDTKGDVIDEALAVIMRSPHSYTGEDVVELQCHGGVVVMRKILDLTLALGARLAEPGEFTKRAFLNGRIDLSQAEAVIDIIRSKTDRSLDLAVQQLEGSLSRRIQSLREKLYDLVVQVNAAIDFPEDDIPEITSDRMQTVLGDVIAEITRLIDTADNGKFLREGIKTVITGKPNVGKSSLLNRLLDENRALVTDIPGTTRDTIEEVLNINGIPFRLVDTAGIHRSTDRIEQLGVERALEFIGQADLILHVLDISRELEEEDRQLLRRLSSRKRVLVINKTDLPPQWNGKAHLIEAGYIDARTPAVEISLTEESLDPLLECIVGLVMEGLAQIEREDAIITRSRHKQALVEAKADLEQALETFDQGLPLDLISIGLFGALEHLGEITGETVRENIIERIFAQFCIGK
ncbi:MAG: tRNA uridine-5-carboxymethylaminomethyl(34) synthesis GTPase MnmE [Firmicutes bacterium]|jgi:tRNA modification GTPase|nr:tRNA uridine-5-carboxymethylaminomethyl(34) synthesis GTPase MnmE [Bacillota bacterium]NLL87371.1 tRNA uridine-5-carboxymethylaminomethyl(34) synthesis GTPase MnmE [Bacillota bacterium]HKM18164.1 tRNA uridine-5-carboxymethylaminomethyl(34) synthesis GTPase MnmE [Limnochordia bacterium]